MANLVLSSSSVAAYHSCHYRWKLEYIERHPSVMGLPVGIGQAVHAGVEAYYQGRMGLSGDDPMDVLTTTFLFETAALEDTEDPLDKALIQAQRVLTSYIEDVGQVTDPLLVEYGFLLDINGILFSGHLDLADKAGVVRDLKVKKAKPRRFDDYRFGMVGYVLGYRDATDEQETDFQLDIMIRLKRDRPYHVAMANGGPITDTDIGVFARALEDVAEGITKGDFTPTGLGPSCRWCPVKHSCEYFAALEETNAT